MDGLNENSLVLVLVTLGAHIKEVVDVVVDLSLLAILAEESSQNSLSSDPQDLGGHTSLSGSSTLAGAGVSTLPLGQEVQSNSGSRVDSDGLLDDESILDKLANSLSGVSNSNLAGLVRVEPDTALSALGDRSGKASLELQ